MDSGGPSPYRGPVADLVDPYVTKDTAAETAARIGDWLKAHPGRWALFFEGDQGVDGKNLTIAGYEVAQRTSKLSRVRRAYARVPHPEGESLDEALSRSAGSRPVYPEDLPDLEKDSFNWTKDELEAAIRAARENLFPVRAARGSGRKRK